MLMLFIHQLMASASIGYADLGADFQKTYSALLLLGNGAICTAMLWATMLSQLIDHNLKKAAVTSVVAAGCSLVGLIHSPFPDGRLYLPGTGLPAPVYAVTAGYLLMGTAYLIMSGLNRKELG